MKKHSIVLMFAILTLLFTSCAAFKADAKINSAVETISPNSAEVQPMSVPIVEDEPRVVRFSATGDNLIHDGIYLQAAERANGNGYDFAPLYANVADFYKQFDVNWINQETLVTDELPPSSYPTFCTPTALAIAAHNIGFNVFAMSNNHSYDKGALGIAATRRFWETMPDDIVTTGFFEGDADYDNIPIHEVNGVKIAYLAYTQYTNGIPTPKDATAHIILTSDEMLIERQVRLAQELADFVVVGVHWGNEGSHTVTEAQRALAQKIADFGADAIIGTHPHVIQPVEWIISVDQRKIPIAYSLGNFVSTQSAAPNMIGLVLNFDITENESGNFTAQNVAATPTVTHYDAHYKNVREYLYKDYTDELAQKHGVNVNYPSFSREYISGLLKANISSEFLNLN
ncbi:MAG: CapA family protein [Oscillospiraceae bacterium]